MEKESFSEGEERKMSLQTTIKQFITEGQKAEILFASTAEKQGYEAVKSSKLADYNEHWDYLIKKAGKSLHIEVKSQKKFSRHWDKGYMEDYAWVELHGVTKYNKGWLCGKADLIAFETKDSFILVPKDDLRNFVIQKTNGQNPSFTLTTPEDMLYKKYTRGVDRCDIIVLVAMLYEWKK
jgi:hypothetical protein